MKLFIIVILIGAVLSCQGQLHHQGMPPVFQHLNAYSSKHADVFSFGANQASMAGNKLFSAGIWSERKFMLQELTSYRIAVMLPIDQNNFGVQAGYSGNKLMNESGIGLAYARKTGKLNAGVQFNFYRIHAQTYGQSSTINFEAGLIYEATDKIHAGLHVYNPLQGKIGKSEESLPFILSSGIGYDASEKFFMAMSIIKTSDQPVDIQVGMQYCIDEKLVARMGATTGITSFYFSSGYKISDLRVDVTASFHQYLGVTPGLMLIYSPGKK